MDFLEYLKGTLPVQAAGLPLRALDWYNNNVSVPIQAHALDISTRDDLGAQISRNTPVGLLMRAGMGNVSNKPVLKKQIQQSLRQGDKKGAVAKFAESEGFFNTLLSGAATDPLSYLGLGAPAMMRAAQSGNQIVRAAGKAGLVANDPIGAALNTQVGKQATKAVKEQAKKIPVPKSVSRIAGQARDSWLQMRNREIANALHQSIGVYFPDRPSEGVEFLDTMEKRAAQAGYSSIPEFITSKDFKPNTDIEPKFLGKQGDNPSTFERYIQAITKLGREYTPPKETGSAPIPPRPAPDPDADYNRGLFNTAIKQWQKQTGQLFDPSKITPEMEKAVAEEHFKGGALDLLSKMFRGEWQPPVPKEGLPYTPKFDVSKSPKWNRARDEKLQAEAAKAQSTDPKLTSMEYLTPDELLEMQNLNPSYKPFQTKIDDFTEKMKSGEWDIEKSPLLVEYDEKGKPFLVEGGHRAQAAKAAGLEKLKVEIKKRLGVKDEEAEWLAAKAAAEAEMQAAFKGTIKNDLATGVASKETLLPKQLAAIGETPEVSPFQKTGLAIPADHWQVLQSNKDNIIEGAKQFEDDRTLITQFLKSEGVDPSKVENLGKELKALTSKMGDKNFKGLVPTGEARYTAKEIDKAYNFWNRMGINPLSGDEAQAINSYINKHLKGTDEAKEFYSGVGNRFPGWPKWQQAMRLWRSQAVASVGNLVYNASDAGIKNLLTIGKESLQSGKFDGNTVMMNPLYTINKTIENMGVKDPGDFLQPPDVLRKQSLWGQVYEGVDKKIKSIIPVELRQNWSYLEDQSTLSKNPWDDALTPNKRAVVGGAAGLVGGGLPGAAMGALAGKHMNDIVRVFRLASGSMEFSARTAQWMYHKEKFLTENIQAFADSTFSANNPAKAAFLSDGIYQSPEMLAKKLKGYDQATINKAVQGWTNMLSSADKAGVEQAFKVHFDYGNFTGIDAALRNVTSFHYWATRNVPWYGEYLIHNPWLSTSLWRLQATSDRIQDDNNLPDRMKTLLPTGGMPDFLTKILFGSEGEFFSNPAQYISILQQLNKQGDESSVAGRVGQLGNMGMGLNPALDTAAQLLGVKGTDPINNVMRISAPISGIAGVINRKPSDVEAPYKNAIGSLVETATGKAPFDPAEYAIKKLIAERSVTETGKPNDPRYVAAMNDPESQIYKDAAAQVANTQGYQSLYYFTGQPVYKFISKTEKAVKKQQMEGPDQDEESIANTYTKVNDPVPEDPKVILEKWRNATTKERLVLWRDPEVRRVVGDFTKSRVKK